MSTNPDLEKNQKIIFSRSLLSAEAGIYIYIYIYIYMYILESSGRPSGGLDSSGSHSDQGSQNPGIA